GSISRLPALARTRTSSLFVLCSSAARVISARSWSISRIPTKSGPAGASECHVECTSTGGSADVAGPKEARKASSRAVSWVTWLGTGGGSGRKATLRFIDDEESDEEEAAPLDDDAEAGALRG